MWILWKGYIENNKFYPDKNSSFFPFEDSFREAIKEFFPSLKMMEAKKLILALCDSNKEIFFYTSGLFGNSPDHDGWINIFEDKNKKYIEFGCPAI